MITAKKLANKFVLREGRVTISSGTMYCPYKCTYCYAPHVVHGLTKLIQYSPSVAKKSLLLTKDFKKGKAGTMIFIGRDVEVFAPVDIGIAFIREIATLGNQMSVSTKTYITKEYAKEFSQILKDKKQLGILVTITCWDSAPYIEPGAPAPELRIETIKNLADEGFNVFLYIKPISPGIKLREYKTLIKKAKEAGAKGVIPGYINIDRTGMIVKSFEIMGFNTKKLRKLMKKSILKPAPFAYKDEEGSLWYYVYDRAAFKAIKKYAKEYNLKYFENSISAISSLKKSRLY